MLAVETGLLSYQKEAVERLLERGGCGGLFMQMGTGKTRAALEICRRKGAKRILCVLPLSVAGVWKREAALYWPELTVVPLVTGSVLSRAKRAVCETPSANDDLTAPVMFTVNYDSYWKGPLRKALLDFAPDAVIYDEAHRLKGRGTKQTRFAHMLADRVPVRLALTGTPMPNGAQDLFALYKAVDERVFGKRFADFRDRYLKMGGYLGYQIVGYQHTEEIEEKVAQSAYRITKDEALDLPEQVDVIVPIELDKYDIYERMRKKAIAELEKPLEGTILARLALTNLLRLQQITSGFARVTTGEEVILSHEKERVLNDLLDDVEGRVVVFCRFTHDVKRASTGLKRKAYTLDGSVPPQRRQEVLDSFARDSTGVLVAQIQVGSLGIDLSCANVAVFYSLDYSLANYAQARDRLHRLGQTNKVTYYHLLAARTVDEKVFNVLRSKENLSASLLDSKRLISLFS